MILVIFFSVRMIELAEFCLELTCIFSYDKWLNSIIPTDKKITKITFSFMNLHNSARKYHALFHLKNDWIQSFLQENN